MQSPSATADGFFYIPFLAQFLSLQKCRARTLIKTSPFLTGSILPLQEFGGVYLK